MDELYLERLPEPYAVFFRLRAEGLTIDEIADRLELPREAMTVFVEIAYGKLGRVKAELSVSSPIAPESDCGDN